MRRFLTYSHVSKISTHAPLAGRDKESGGIEYTADVISTHAPLAGRDGCWRMAQRRKRRFQPTRPLRGATGSKPQGGSYHENFNPRAPCGARLGVPTGIEIFVDFNPRAPCGARLHFCNFLCAVEVISTHAPLAGRDDNCPLRIITGGRISTHAPLAGRDTRTRTGSAPRTRFQPTRPLRGATCFVNYSVLYVYIFQPTRPLRGATDGALSYGSACLGFQPTRPLRGATAKVYKSLCTFLR